MEAGKTTPTVEIKSHASNKSGVSDVLITVHPPTTTKRLPMDVVCVIDNSGSMGSSASIKTEDGKSESHGLNLLDIVVHGVKTIIAALGPEDRIGVVTFESRTDILHELGSVDKETLEKLNAKLDKLVPMGGTGLWSGLTTGIEQITKNKKEGRVTSLVLLTDGVPTDKQPPQVVSSLRELKASATYDGQLPTINTFGFGYGINSDMLLELAQIGNGTYSFIPDAGFVGTVFVNCTANNLCMFSPVVSLEIKPLNNTKIITPLPSSKIIQLDSLQFDQTRDFAFQVSIDSKLGKDEPYLEAIVSYEDFGGKRNQVVQVKAQGTDRDGSPLVTAHAARWALIRGVQQAVDSRQKNPNEKAAFADLLAQIPESLAIHKDLTGQITEAFSKPEYYNKWGKHYLPSLLRAHSLQQCTNFKDPGLQDYGGKMFSDIRDDLDDKFLSIPPPKPKANTYGSYYGSSSSSTSSSASYSMSSYYSSSAPCFSGECHVQKWDEVTKAFETALISSLTQGDIVVGDHGKKVKIECVLKTNSSNGSFDLVELHNGLMVTPWHPVREAEGQEWRFPSELGKVQSRKCEAVYSFVLEAGMTLMEINQWQCVSLGHGRKEDEVVKHEYFGSERVVEDLRKMRGWSSGKIEMMEGCMVRGADGLVSGLNADMEMGAQACVPDN